MWNEKQNLRKPKRQKANGFWNQQIWQISNYFSIISIKIVKYHKLTVNNIF